MLVYAIKRFGVAILVALTVSVLSFSLIYISGELYWLPMFTYAKYYVFSSDLDFKTTPDEIPRFYTAKWK